MRNRVTRGLVGSATVALVAAALVLLPLSGASADPDPGSPIGSGQGSGATELTVGDLLNIGSVAGGINASVTATTPYPADPGPGVPITNETTAQLTLVDINNPNGPIQGLAYCIDLHTNTTVGVNYKVGDWTTANVPNLPYVNYILTHYYPNVIASPAGTAVEKVQAVQAAIWYFTDQFILSGNSSTRVATSAIIADAQANAGGGPPPLPTLAVTPTTAVVPDTGDLVGPFTVGGTIASSTLEARGVDVFTDSAGTEPLSDGASVLNGTQLWIRYASTVALEGFHLTSVQTVTGGNVFLYDGSNPGRTEAQKLILASTTDLPIRAGVTATVQEAGRIQVTKVIDGSGASLQAAIAIDVSCDLNGTITDRSLNLPAGTVAGPHDLPLISGVPAGSICTISEPENGTNGKVSVTATTITPESVTIADQATASVVVANNYAAITPPPTPTPTPTPKPRTLAATGSGIDSAGWAALALSGAGVLLVALGMIRRRQIR